jgi:hypothetical protein
LPHLAPGYSLADLTRKTGSKRRTVQLWAEAGVIQADPDTERAGTGTHRRFAMEEAIIACIVHPLARRQISIGELLKISASVRTGLKTSGYARTVIESVIHDRGGSGLISIVTWDGGIEVNFHKAIARTSKAVRALFEEVGAMATGHLEKPGAMAMIIRLETVLASLR